MPYEPMLIPIKRLKEDMHMSKCKQELFVKGSEMFNMLGDFYELNKRLMNGDENGQRTDAYFEWCVAEADAFTTKHPSRYARALAMTLLEELENRYKEEKDNTVAA